MRKFCFSNNSSSVGTRWDLCRPVVQRYVVHSSERLVFKYAHSDEVSAWRTFRSLKSYEEHRLSLLFHEVSIPRVPDACLTIIFDYDTQFSRYELEQANVKSWAQQLCATVSFCTSIASRIAPTSFIRADRDVLTICLSPVFFFFFSFLFACLHHASDYSPYVSLCFSFAFDVVNRQTSSTVSLFHLP
jgi:hypothetical protein